MAAHAFIIDHEDKVIDAIRVVKEIVDAANVEMQVGGNLDNNDCWGTLAINLIRLSNRCTLAIDKITLTRQEAKKHRPAAD